MSATRAMMPTTIRRPSGTTLPASPQREACSRNTPRQPISPPNDVGVVDEPVDNGGGGDVVAEDFSPSTERLIAGDQASAFVAAEDESEQRPLSTLRRLSRIESAPSGQIKAATPVMPGRWSHSSRWNYFRRLGGSVKPSGITTLDSDPVLIRAFGSDVTQTGP
jgi:hypothetical protein